MMICKADFEELFPECFASQIQIRHEAAAPSQACIARWEDDGGFYGPAFEHSRSHDQRVHCAESNLPNPRLEAIRWAKTVNTLAFSGLFGMFAGFGIVPKDKVQNMIRSFRNGV